MTATSTEPRPQPTARPPGPRRTSSSSRGLGYTLLADYFPIALAVLLVILPLAYLVLSSFKGPDDLLTRELVVFPSPLRAENYGDAASSVPFPRLFLNSAIVTTVGAGLKVVLAIFTAYALVFVEFPGRTYVFWAVLATMMVPPQVTMVPNFVFISSLGGQDTYWGIILPGLATGFGTFLLRQAFLSLPLEIIEAAALDGAGHWNRLWRMVVPMAAPSIATVALVNIVFEWNDYLWPLVIVSEPSMMTLPVGLTLLSNSESQAISYGIVMAGTVMVLVPVLLVFAALQRHIVSGLTQGGVKA